MLQKMVRSKKSLGMILGVAIILLVLLSFFAANGYARYRTQVIVANEVTYKNQLASSFKLLDREMQLNKDGTYSLADSNTTNAGNDYYLIPGTRPPAAPCIEIKGKTEIPAYLYLEVVSDNGPSIQFGDGWTKLQLRGRNGGNNDDEVYVFNTVLDGTQEDLVVYPALVTEVLPSIPSPDGGKLTFYAYMIQKTDQTESFEFDAAKAAFVEAVSRPTQER